VEANHIVRHFRRRIILIVSSVAWSLYFLITGSEVTVDMEANTLTDHSSGKTYNLQPIGDVSAAVHMQCGDGGFGFIQRSSSTLHFRGHRVRTVSG
jgi:hypothetical protein